MNIRSEIDARDAMHAWTEQELGQAFRIAYKVCQELVPYWSEMTGDERNRLLIETVKATATLMAAYEG